ncbi:RNA-dependent DNA polymerase [bacterium endosymbiont of Escarpia laminata]|nr:MAG: RNA-dependent DNA polymerase [bacterium endosymbiont of Escarpia laminata]
MKRHGNLFDSLVSFENLHLAANKARKSKRHKPDVARYFADLENNLICLQRSLGDLSWQPGPYRSFEIREPKTRLISAAHFSDRVVHHALCNIVEPLIDRSFIYDSYANRKGKGTHRAILRCGDFMRCYPYVLQCDIRKYFPSIDHQILKAELHRRLKDRRVLLLLERIIDGSNQQEAVYATFPGDDLFTPLERRQGLPIGNLTSQFLANLYMDPLDQFIKRHLKCRAYLRYSDDFLLFAADKRTLNDWRAELVSFLSGLRLRLHSGKSRVYPSRDGITFLGFRHFPHYRRIVRPTVTRRWQRLKELQAAYRLGEIGLGDVTASMAAWNGHARYANSWSLREQMMEGVVFSQPEGVQ